MTTPRDPDRLIHAFLLEGAEQLQDQVYDAVRAGIEQKRQRVAIGPWRMPLMSKFVSLGLGAAAVVVALVIGVQLLGPAAPGGVGGAPSPDPSASPSPSPIGGTVQYQIDGQAATTEVTAVADGTSVSGTAVTTFSGLTHTVGLECAVDYGDTWAFAGTTEQSTVPDEVPGAWSVVFIKEGSPQQIAIVFSIGKSPGDDCDRFLGNFSGWDRSALSPAESGALVPPPDLAP
jgi:hypothetical protein